MTKSTNTFGGSEFNGFFKETFEFLSQLYTHNSVSWFNKHRNEYEKYLMTPARAFVVSIAPFIKFINPAFDTEPKFNRTLVRINRDMRFAKKPYKDFLLIRFGKSKWDSELFLYIDRNGVEIGTFINNEKNGGRRLFEENILAHTESFIQICREYKIGADYAAYELRSDTERIADHFNAKRDHGKFKGIDYLIFGRDFQKSNPIIYSKRLLATAMKIYNRLYPLYIFSSSTNPIFELEGYRKQVGLLSISVK
jgi:hypothetical protein